MFKLFLLTLKHLSMAACYRAGYSLRLTAKPLFLNFPITYRCNARCLMCDIWKKYSLHPSENKNTLKDEITASDISNFIKSNKGFLSDLKSIGFTGGEAFLREDIVEIVRLVHEGLPNADVGVQTNGLLPEMIRGKIKEILKFYPDFKIAVSLDGVGSVHDEMRGVKGAYDKAVATINYAKGLGVAGITCGMTLTKDNFDKIHEVAQAVKSLGCEFSCFLPEASGYFGNTESPARLSEAQLKTIARQLEDFRYHYFMDNLRMQILKEAGRTLPCYSGYTSYVIDPYGEILPCILLGDSFGNIKDGLFKGAVSSQRAWDIRKKIKRCRCWCQCEVSTSVVTSPFDVIRWFLKSKNKSVILDSLNRKVLINRL